MLAYIPYMDPMGERITVNTDSQRQSNTHHRHIMANTQHHIHHMHSREDGEKREDEW